MPFSEYILRERQRELEDQAAQAQQAASHQEERAIQALHEYSRERLEIESRAMDMRDGALEYKARIDSELADHESRARVTSQSLVTARTELEQQREELSELRGAI